MTATNLTRAALATRLAFLAAGFVMACWAPLIPFAKAQVGASEGTFGLLLLCLGLGSIVAMPVTGYISARTGARPMILLGGFGLVALLPLLVLAQTVPMLAAALALFGAALGTIDVAMNVHAAEVETREGRPMMSGFHAMWSVGGILGAGGVTALLWTGAGPLTAALSGSALAFVAMVVATPRFLRAAGGTPPTLALPRGTVLLLAVLAAICFLVEGAVLDWGALLIVAQGLMEPTGAGIGYMLFSIAMTVARLTGDRIVAALGQTRVLILGGLVAIAGIGLTLVPGAVAVALAGFVLIGLGCANLVPVVFSLAARQPDMAPGLAVAAVTTTGYAGILLGPALVGFAAEATSLAMAFALLAGLMLAFPLTARRITRA
ncbi:MFS transporter [Roseibacterium sp. SDUM158016]|uniref:MFS transporter n=1 Tax=Roseicyclus sediminis TaxID=2980997 RepID=UPI0021D2C2BE|nr:MFS transporter [Roseibacterium sp. SDUM158016]MCU4654425.1 MFS transporter [Roseibacterium sp. SDUM158016]